MACTAFGGLTAGSDEKTNCPGICQNHVSDEIIIKFKGPAARALEKEIPDTSDSSYLGLTSSLNKLNKRYHLAAINPLFRGFKADRERLKTSLNKRESDLSGREKRILRRLKRAPKQAAVPALDRIYKLRFNLEHNDSIEDVLAAYSNDPCVEYAELNYIVSINQTPNDPLYPLQWSLNNTGQMYPESGKYNHPPGTPDCDIDAPEAWDINSGSPELIIAVVDTGVDYTHRDLDDNMWINETEFNGVDGVDDDENGYIDDIYGYNFCTYEDVPDGDPIDDHGHGTHCSGIITAEGNNGFDIAGVCRNTQIMALKFLGASGKGYTSDAVTAFYYAVDNGADIISNSWGGGTYLPALQEIIDYAHSQGVIMVASAGNDHSDFPHYPACYDHVIAVAATDSDDHKAPLSNYGDWIDIAAPGVDVLSLRAAGTSMGTTYDDYTTIGSGTSMACPHVAGVIVLLLAQYPYISFNELTARLLATADNISAHNPGYDGLLGSGRVNAYKAVRDGFEGVVTFDSDFYSCDDIVSIEVLDFDLAGEGPQQVTVITSGGDSETVTLSEDSNKGWVFAGIISTDSGNPNIEDGIVQISHGEIINTIYIDADDGTGNQAIAIDTTDADCEGPLIFNIQVDNITSSGAVVTFETDEPATGYIRCGQVCGGPYTIAGEDLTLATTHTVYLSVPSSETDYYFVVDVNDAAGNESTDDNAGQCYSFTTISIPPGIHVPRDYPSIQAAIDAAVDGDTIWVADDVYTGEGNRDIDFKGKAITVANENGPHNCIIDCQGSRFNPRRGFYFHSGEDFNSLVDNITVMNGYGHEGGGIYIENSSPTISNCKIIYNNAECGGGGIYATKSKSLIRDCIISFNESEKCSGGGIVGGSCTIINCVIENNRSESGGGVSAVSSMCINCTIRDNTAFGVGGWGDGVGGGISVYGSSAAIINNCRITGNKANLNGGGIWCKYFGRATITQCTISGNFAANNGGGIYSSASYPCIIGSIVYGNRASAGNELFLTDWNDNVHPSYCTISYSDIKNNQFDVCVYNDSIINWGEGNIDADPCFVDPIRKNYRLRDSSPCIDKGIPYYKMFGDSFADIDSNCRLAGSGLDMGSYEFGSTPDSDADLIPDANEVLYNCKPDDPDSDDDGLFDGIEILRGTDPNVVTKLEGISIPSDYRSIQEGIFLSLPLENIVVSPGVYNENVHFQGKDVILQGIDPLDSEIVETTIIDPCGVGTVITFKGSESSQCVLSGLSIRNGGFSGISGNGCKALIEYNRISDNYIPSMEVDNGGGGMFGCDGTIQYNIVTNNIAEEAGGGLNQCHGTIRGNMISKNTSGFRGGGIGNCSGLVSENIIVGNYSTKEGGGIYCEENPEITNCVINDNTTSEGVYGDGGGIYSYRGNPVISNCTIVGNKARGNYGRGGGIYCYRGNPKVSNCILWNNTGLRGSQLSLCKGDILISYSDVEGGSDGVYVDEGTLYWLEGNIDADPCFVDPNNDDYHLKSQAGRWDPYSVGWIIDAVTSPCIDKGDSGSDWMGELWPHGKRINMGAFGGTPEASMSLVTAGNAADLNNDGSVNQKDFQMLLDFWLDEDIFLAEDINRDSLVNFLDFARLAQDWLWKE